MSSAVCGGKPTSRRAAEPQRNQCVAANLSLRMAVSSFLSLRGALCLAFRNAKKHDGPIHYLELAFARFVRCLRNMSQYIAMNRFKIVKGHESDFEEIWKTRNTYLDGSPGFIEFRLFLDQCRFRDCSHLVEKDCGVLAALENNDIRTERYQSFVNIVRDIDSQSY